MTMSGHERLDQFSLAMAREVARRVDEDPALLERARATALRWQQQCPRPSVEEWLALLELPWQQLRSLYLDEGDEGQRLRSTAPFSGILSPAERLGLFQPYRAS